MDFVCVFWYMRICVLLREMEILIISITSYRNKILGPNNVHLLHCWGRSWQKHDELKELKELVEIIKSGSVKLINVKPQKLDTANEAMNDLKNGKVNGRIVLYP